jgi:hypothetical protein
MPVALTLTEKIVAGPAPVALSQFFAVSSPASGQANPAYLVVTAFDRNAYAAECTGVAGAFAGNGASLGLSPTIGNARAAAIVFTWTAGQYVNATYGAFSALAYTPSASVGEVANISVFTTSNLALATRDAANPLVLAQADPAGNVGSATIVTDAHPYAPIQPPLAGAGVTPDAIAAAAQSFVGRAWNDQGCWNLASTIAAEAGAGLPITATALGVAGHGSGQWVVVYDGPAHANAAWRGLVSTGDIITYGTPGGGGHITICVSGSGAGAMLIDNVVYQNAQGQISNAAGDGSASDVLVAPAHLAAQSFAGVAANSVVIYALDTPVVSARVGAPALSAGVAVPLSAFASVADPGGRAITGVQVYDPGGAIVLMVGGTVVSASSAATAVGVSSLGAVSVEAGVLGGADTLEVRAFNGLSWGDWQGIVVCAPAVTGMFEAEAPVVLSSAHMVDANIVQVPWHASAASSG